MPYEITVDKNKCTGCQNCVNICPGMFKMVGDKSQPIKKKIDKPGCAKLAESECPADAIEVKEV